jgi:enhancing lycopene biosynthesis protein 2
MSTQTITGPIALVKINGITIGKIKDIRATETYSRGEVRGIGNLQAQEVPILSHSGTFSIESFLVDLNSQGVKELLNREVISLEQFINSITMNEQGIDIFIYKKVPKTIDPTSKLVTAIDEQPIGVLRRCFLDNVSFNISEGQVSSHSQSGRFLDPILFLV